MNFAQKQQGEWGFLAGVIEAARGSIHVSGRSIAVTLRPMPHLRRFLGPWMRNMGLDYSEADAKRSPYWVKVLGKSACRALTMSFPYLLSERRRREARCALRWFRTIQRPGVRLDGEARLERRRIACELAGLHAGAGA